MMSLSDISSWANLLTVDKNAMQSQNTKVEIHILHLGEIEYLYTHLLSELTIQCSSGRIQPKRKLNDKKKSKLISNNFKNR